MNHEHTHERHHEDESTRKLQPRIWIGSLADYNAGRLHGDWCDAAVDPSDLRAAVDRILAGSDEPDAEEWGIFDYDDFGDLHVGEYDTLEQVSAVACGIVAHGPAFATWLRCTTGIPTCSPSSMTASSAPMTHRRTGPATYLMAVGSRRRSTARYRLTSAPTSSSTTTDSPVTSNSAAMSTSRPHRTAKSGSFG